MGGEFGEVVRRVRRGEREAFDALYECALPVVWRWALGRARGDASRAEVIVERALRVAFAELDHYDEQTPFESWLLRRASAAERPRRAPAPSSQHPLAR